MMKNLLRPGLAAAKSAGLDLLTASGVDGYEPGWARPYATDPFSPFWYASGDDDEDDEEDDDKGKGDEDEEDEDDEDDDDEDKGKSESELRAEVKRLRAAYLKKLNNSRNRGTRIKELESTKSKHESDLATLQEQLDELKKTAGKEVDSEAAQRRINELVEKAREEGKEAFKPVVIRMAVKAELMAQGARPNLVDRLTKMIDINDVDIDDEDGSIDVTEAVLGVKKDMPEMFGPRKATTQRKRREGGGNGAGEGGEGKGTGTGKGSARKAGGAGGGDEGGGEKKLTAAERVANRLRGISD
ncbi:scaffolding protein [Streptomyces phage Dryad]|nr:scaffolding protein [Streptomyces phage Dryad]